MSQSTKRFMVLMVVVMGCLVLFAAGDPGTVIVEKVDKIKGIAEKVGYSLCALGFIAGGVMKAMGNQRANQLLIGSAIGAFVVAMATSLVSFFQ